MNSSVGIPPVILAIYFLPTIIAVLRLKSWASFGHIMMVFLVNLLSGWTVFGWFYSLAMAAFDLPGPWILLTGSDGGPPSIPPRGYRG